jgi:hypothetical protein
MLPLATEHHEPKVELETRFHFSSSGPAIGVRMILPYVVYERSTTHDHEPVVPQFATCYLCTELCIKYDKAC